MDNHAGSIMLRYGSRVPYGTEEENDIRFDFEIIPINGDYKRIA